MISAAAGMVIAGIIAAAGATTSSAMQNKATREAKEESKNLALIARDDDLLKQNKEFGLAQDQMILNREKLGMEKVRSNFEIYQTRKATKATQLGTLVNALNVNSQKDKNMTNFIMSLYGKTGGV